jgi:hypothetical protein
MMDASKVVKQDHEVMLRWLASSADESNLRMRCELMIVDRETFFLTPSSAFNHHWCSDASHQFLFGRWTFVLGETSHQR